MEGFRISDNLLKFCDFLESGRCKGPQKYQKSAEWDSAAAGGNASGIPNATVYLHGEDFRVLLQIS